MSAILQVYRDIAQDADNKNKGEVNQVHPWWIEFVGGGKRPATDQEVELWQLSQDIQGQLTDALLLTWHLFNAAMGQAPSNRPHDLDLVKAVEKERQRLLSSIETARVYLHTRGG